MHYVEPLRPKQVAGSRKLGGPSGVSPDLDPDGVDRFRRHPSAAASSRSPQDDPAGGAP